MIIYAVNIHTGGGKVLLDTVLEEMPWGMVTCCFLDERYEPPTNLKSLGTKLFFIKPNLYSRWLAEYWLMQECEFSNPVKVVSFGNLPPIFKNKSFVITYLQNALLLPRSRFPKDGLQPLLRNIYERLIWIFFGKNTDEVWVQTPWMKDQLMATTDYKVEVKPIFPTIKTTKDGKNSPEFDYIMVTGPESHKHLNEFIDFLLQKRAMDISLNLIINLGKKNILLEEKISECRKRWPSFKLSSGLSRQEVFEAYQQAETLINTSTVESFCLPIYEAKAFDLKVKCLNQPFNEHIKNGLEKFETIEELVKSL